MKKVIKSNLLVTHKHLKWIFFIRKKKFDVKTYLYFFITLAFIFFVDTNLPAEVHYVSKTGNDKSRKIDPAQLWLTFFYATKYESLKSGDSIHLGEGFSILSEYAILPEGVSLSSREFNSIITGTFFLNKLVEPDFHQDEISNVLKNDYNIGFKDLRNNFCKDNLINNNITGDTFWNIKKSTVFDEKGSALRYPFQAKIDFVGALKQAGKLCIIVPYSLGAADTLPQYDPVKSIKKTVVYAPDPVVNDIFKVVVENTKPPNVLDTIEHIMVDGDIEVSKIHFESIVDTSLVNKLYALIIQPQGKKNLPAMLILHGGTQTADDYYDLGIQFAKKGYACLIPDLPGITSPERSGRSGEGSSGKWTEFAYGAKHFEVKPTAQSSNIYQGITAAIQAFYLLKNQPSVNPSAIGIRGLSWGGYASVITTALLGKQVKAGFAVYGSGFYDKPSYFKKILDEMDSVSRFVWLTSLDAGRYANRITAPFYFMSASNDTYFHPPAVIATFDQMKGTKNILFAPNNDHSLSNLAGADSTEFAFFDHYLKNGKTTLPQIDIKSVARQKDSSCVIKFHIKHSQNIREAVVWFSLGSTTWMKKEWKPLIGIKSSNNNFSAQLPKEIATENGNWYIIATDENGVSNGTRIYCMSN